MVSKPLLQQLKIVAAQIEYEKNGLSVGTLRLNILIRTSPFSVGFSPKKLKGDAEMEERQDKRRPRRYPIVNYVFGSEKKAATITYNYIVANLEKSTEFLCGLNMISQSGTTL
jgi:hypothetical protein